MYLGHSDCNECGGKDTVVLVIRRDGVWSKCLRCGFMEWEWSYGDSIDYLEYLAKEYHISKKALFSALGI